MNAANFKEKLSSDSKARLASIKVKQDTANLIKIYCVFNNRKTSDFACEVFEIQLHDFKKRLEDLRTRH